MERQSSVFGKLRSRANSSADPCYQPIADEWFIPYSARPSLTTRESGIGLSPVPVKPAHNGLLSVFSPSTSAAPYPFAENSRPLSIARPATTPTPANSYLFQMGVAGPSQRPMPRRTGTIVRSPSYNSISDLAVNPSANRIPSSSSVPTGLTAPKMLFSPMERELRGGAWPTWPQASSSEQPRLPPQSQAKPKAQRQRSRTVSTPYRTRGQQQNPYEYRAESRKWVPSTMCDMFVFPRPTLYPHVITPPDTPQDEMPYSLTTGSSEDDRVLEQGAARAREREDWADLVKRRGRSLSFGGQSSPPVGAPVIGNVRARSREASRSNSMVRRDSRDGESGRKRSASFGSLFTSRQSSMTRKNSERSRESHESHAVKQPPTSFRGVKGPVTNRRSTRSSARSFFAGEPEDDDPFAGPKPYESKFRRTHTHSKSNPESLRAYQPYTNTNGYAKTHGPVQTQGDVGRYPAISTSRTLQFRQPSVADKGGVVVISGTGGGRKSSGGGTFRPPPPLDLSKPLPELPVEAKTPLLPETGPFWPLSDEIGVAISPGLRAAATMGDHIPALESEPSGERAVEAPKTAPLPSNSALSPTPRTGRSDGGSATARAFLAKQHQRARTKRAFQSPAQGPNFVSPRREVGSPLSASSRNSAASATFPHAPVAPPSSSSPTTAVPRSAASSTNAARVASPTTAASAGPRRKTALEEAIGRSRAASLGTLDQDVNVARLLSARPRTAESDTTSGSGGAASTSQQGQLKSLSTPPPRIALEPPKSDLASITSNRGMISPPLVYPISTILSPRTAFTDSLTPPLGMDPGQGPKRPDMRHVETNATGVSKATVYTDASEGWSRAASSGRSSPISGITAGIKGRLSLSETPPSETPSPRPSMDGDFSGLFFRTPHDRNGSFSQSTPLPDRYAPPRSSFSMPRIIPERPEPIGLGYGLESQKQTSGVRVQPLQKSECERQGSPEDRRPSDGSEATVEIATPVTPSNPQEQPQSVPQRAMNQSQRSTHLHERRASAGAGAGVTARLTANFVDGRPATPESMTSRSESVGHEDDDAGLETQRTAVPIGVDGTEFPFPTDVTGTATAELAATSATNMTPDGKRRSSVSPPHLSPGTFGIIPDFTTAQSQQSQHQPQSTQSSKQNQPSLLTPFDPSYSLSPFSQTRPHPARGSFSHSPQPDALSPTLGVDASPLPDGNPRHSAAVSFFDDFPSPPTLPTGTMISNTASYPSPVKHQSAFGQVVTGPPGAGKSTYCHGLHQFLTALHRPIHIINLDPAVPNPPYPCSINICDLITLDSIQEEYNLGPNGAMLYAVEYLEANFDWLTEKLDQVLEQEGGNGYAVFDTPGQVELWTNHDSLKNVVGRLTKMDYRLAAVHLSDAHYITDASKFISVVLLALRAMLQMEMPHVNVLSKIDLLSTYGELPFDLSYYTEVQDLSYLLGKLNAEPRAGKFGKLNKAMVELVEEFGLVGFETLAVEDKASMLNLVRLVDKMTGYIYLPQENKETTTPNTHALFSSAMSAKLGSDVTDVQERWLGNKEAWDEWEKEEWRKEGERRAVAAAAAHAREAGTGEGHDHGHEH